MLINFSLVPVANVAPWGAPENPNLSWFGLTDGEYWIEVGGARLFEYSEHVRAAGTDRFCNYQVVRLYEDLLDMLPTILDPVPVSLVQYISVDSGRSWRERYRTWCDAQSEIMDDDQYWQIVDSANTWISRRYLDSMYLNPSASISIWSDSTHVHIEWDNTDKFIDGELAWTAAQGHFQLTRSDFLAEIRSFHDRLMDEMSVRVALVLAGLLSPDISIDLPGLAAEHEFRKKSLECALTLPAESNWPETEKGIRQILGDDLSISLSVPTRSPSGA